MSKNWKVTIAAVCAVLLIVGMLCAWYFGYYAPRQDRIEQRGTGEISITVQITHKDGKVKKWQVNTDAVYLSDALLEVGLMEAHDDMYGLYIDAMDGEAASADHNEAWCFDINGVMGETSVSQTLIEDGGVYAFYILTW